MPDYRYSWLSVLFYAIAISNFFLQGTPPSEPSIGSAQVGVPSGIPYGSPCQEVSLAEPFFIACHHCLPSTF
jgi:hypothetical protein